MQRAVVVLPQPDSPTRASVSPCLTVNETSSTARTWPMVLRRKPWRMGKNLRSCLTSSSASGVIEVTVPLVELAGMDCHVRLVVQKTAYGLSPAQGLEPGLVPIARARHELWAARVERAAGRAVVRMRNRSADRGQLTARLVTEAGNRPQQRLRIRMARIEEQIVDGALLDDFAQVHDDHVVGHLGHDAQVVRDEHDRHAVLGLQLAQQLEDLRLG